MNWSLYKVVVGVDEAGRGPLAGPVTAGAVLLGPAVIEGLDDSKKLTARQREQLSAEIIEECVAYQVAHASVEEIEQLNILEATFIAMQRAVNGIVIVPDEVLVDGSQAPDLAFPTRTVVGGDATIPEIMAASVLAKHARDEVMAQLDEEFPEYGFARHKGYPTPEHQAALDKHGPCTHHRANFAPVARALQAHGGKKRKMGE